jgi:signal transduction histidine kinase
MSDKSPSKDRILAASSSPALAEMLFAAMNEHEVMLTRVSRLLHDDVSQVLSAVGLQLDAIRMDFREQAPGVDSRAAEIQELLEQAIEQLRDITNELNPSIVERTGLQFALEGLVGKIRAGFTGKLRLNVDASLHVPTDFAKAFYKIAECALTLAKSTPGCSLVNVQVKRSRGEYVLEISDNADVSKNAPAPLEQLLMEYHASENHLALQIERVHGKGSLVRASFRLPDEASGSGR